MRCWRRSCASAKRWNAAVTRLGGTQCVVRIGDHWLGFRAGGGLRGRLKRLDQKNAFWHLGITIGKATLAYCNFPFAFFLKYPLSKKLC